MYFSLFPQSVYTIRRKVLKELVGSGLIVLMGNEESGMNYKDNCYHFRQDSSFLYYFGLDTPGLGAIIDADTGAEIIFGNELTLDDIVWTGPLPTLKEMAAEVGVNQTKPYAEFGRQIIHATSVGKKVHFLPPYRPENLLKLSEWLQLPVSAIKTHHSVELIKAVVKQRSIKESIEIEAIEQAVSISADMHFTAMHKAAIGMKEYELVAKVQEIAHAAGGQLSYPVILTINGQTLHNHFYGNTLSEGNMVLVDAGAEQNMHYAGDLTRTFPVGRQFSTQQREVYDIVLNSLERATALLQPGVQFIDIHAKAAEALVAGLKEIGLVKGDPAEAVREGVHTLFFQCGLGHMMGLDVHDMEDLGEEYVGYTDQLKKRTDFGWKSLRLGKALEPGFILTVEPGIYMIPELIDRWKAEKKLSGFINYGALEKYRNFGGIRIENNFLVTTEGYHRLGKYLPDSAREIESIRDQYA
ncbi:aminopeptidase P family protein [Flavihumibacter profundi]|jgi:Xaa-Pro aminopeptidase|uniref:aminopeptidase P family protein n=1 Tax=Flavihumibacter profundi TaxID=2716883 RepID=UPI001CC5EA10|nr:aminopeptidase P family protein [Flavihumibacter profundi]MBZ5859282.1 aminopeptidase P N-terminal domain-containing protein [Flavihumibacter profundi]